MRGHKFWLLTPCLAAAVLIDSSNKKKSLLHVKEEDECAEASNPDKIIAAAKLYVSYISHSKHFFRFYCLFLYSV